MSHKKISNHSELTNLFKFQSVDETPTFSLKHISKPLEAKSHITTSNLKGQLTHLLARDFKNMIYLWSIKRAVKQNQCCLFILINH